MRFLTRRFHQRTAWLMLFCMFFQILLPTQALALTNGPKQPEFDSFTPVSTTNMVNTFTGGFNYNLPVLNIPGADGGGYALSLSYDANPNVESQASWVGANWTLSPGSMDRAKRGVPDDWKDKIINEYNKTDPDVTFNYSTTLGVEFASKDKIGKLNISLNDNYVFNNYTGFRQTIGVGVTASASKGVLGASLNLGLNLTGRDVSFSAGFQFSLNLKGLARKAIIKKLGKINRSETKTQEEKLAETNKVIKNWEPFKFLGRVNSGLNTNVGANFSTTSLLSTSLAPSITPYRGFSVNGNFQARIGAVPTIGARVGLGLGVSIRNNIPWTKHHAYGYMYNRNRDEHAAYNADITNNVVQSLFNGFVPNPIMSDYYVEKAAPYTIRDNVVGIPFNNADNYTIMGEGLSGSFRLHHNQVGHFYPNFSYSESVLINLGLDLNLTVGTTIGVGGGFNAGAGYSRTTSGKWLNQFYGDKFNNDGGVIIDDYRFDTDNQPAFFRFAGDMGGDLDYGNFEVSTATLASVTKLPRITNTNQTLPERQTNDYYSKQSSNILQVKNNEINTDATFQQNAFDVSANTKELTQWSREASTESDGIGQMRVTNPDGIVYTYGIPSYVINEKSLSFGVKGNNPALYFNNLVYQDAVEDGSPQDKIRDNNRIVGQEMEGAYASNYLLTQITTYDYVDLTNNGPTTDDFGGYTKFNYRKWKDSDSSNDGQPYENLYCFRSPYTGLSYSKGSIADGRDDLGSVQKGLKELHYLKTIETKSHVALFITNKTVASSDFTEFGTEIANNAAYNGSGDVRADGLGANIEQVNGNKSKAAKDNSAKGVTQSIEKLERIVLFSKDDLTKPLVCTYMEYDYSTWPNLPNNINGNYPLPLTNNAKDNGKLTLKKVWSEYEGVKPYKISPYEFEYEYKKATTIDTKVKNRYPALFGNIANNIPSDWPNYAAGAECPAYTPHTLDAWGCHQFLGKEQSQKLRSWVWQGEQDNNVYDPAAWQLKQIKLPSGGEILVQYEQKDYTKVQDRNPFAMVSLLPISKDNTLNTANKFYLNLVDLGIDPTDSDKIQALKKLIEDTYVGNIKKRLYFKFLYDLTGTSARIDNAHSEYISGYAPVAAVEIAPNGSDIYVTLGSTNVNFSGASRNDLDVLPRKLCYDHIIYNYNFSSASNAQVTNFVENDLGGADELVDETAQIAVFENIPTTLFESLVPSTNANSTGGVVGVFTDINTVCKNLNSSLSYIRVPMVDAKKGGGIRVKRIMLYDEGLEEGAAELYGTEYIYEKEDGSSSGVAANEPSGAREESALVDYEYKYLQKFPNRLLAGKDRKELEAPFGESLLPVQSVGHSRVIVQNIHKGATNSGFTEHTFFTCQDYPYDHVYKIDDESGNFKGVDYTKILGKKNNEQKQRDRLLLPLGFLNYSKDDIFVAQGWRFIKNDMNGKPKAVRSYGGVYRGDLDGNAIPDIEEVASLETTYDYFEPGEKANVMRYDKSDSKYKIEQRHLGMEMDITMTMQSIKDESLDFDIEVDLGAIVPPSIEFTFSPAINYNLKAYSTHLTSKVINFPAVARSVTTTKNGTTTKSENLAFSDLTGQPLLTKVTDGYHDLYVPDGNGNSELYDGSVYNWSIPAAWFYDELSRSDGTQNSPFNVLNASVGSVTSYGEEGNMLAQINPDNSLGWTTNPQGVLSASAMTYSTGWLSASGPAVEADYNIESNATIGANGYNYNDLKTALDAIPRPHDTYIFEGKISKDAIGGNELLANSTNRSYEAGNIENFVMFDWGSSYARTNQTLNGWRWVSGVDKYSPNGYALEETNPLDIPSTAKYGYHKFLSTAVAQNAEYETVFFESFEDEAAGINATDINSHAGKRSWQLGVNDSYIINNLMSTDKLRDAQRGGLQLKLWAYKARTNTIDYNTSFEVTVNGTTIGVEEVAQVGDWVLLSVDILPANLITTGSINLSLTNRANFVTYIDDVRVQPRYGEMMAYVYNPKDFKVVATFDDEHFGVYYQYNEEGQLTRKYIETEKGTKLLQESQYNSHTKPRQ